MRDPRKLIKVEKWWNDKVPPILALSYYLVAMSTEVVPLWKMVLAIVAFMVAFIGIAGFGYVVNDIFDIECDRAVGKRNAMDGKPVLHIVLISLGLLVLGGLPWLILPANVWNLSLIGFQVFLLIIYAAPPLRLKERPICGVLTDGFYANTVPVLITWTTWSQLGTNAPNPALLVVLTIWAACSGIRGILNHQEFDAENDVVSGVTTFVTKYGRERSAWLVSHITLPVEFICFVWMNIVFSQQFWFYLPLLLLVLCWRSFELAYMWQVPMGWPWKLHNAGVVKLYGYHYLRDFYAGWLPVLMLVLLCSRSWVYLPLAAAHLLLFKTDIVHAIRKEFRYLPGGIARMRGRPY